MVGDPEEDAGGLLSTSTGASDPVMVKQWQYLHQDEWMTDDPTLTVEGDNDLPLIM